MHYEHGLRMRDGLKLQPADPDSERDPMPTFQTWQMYEHLCISH